MFVDRRKVACGAFLGPPVSFPAAKNVVFATCCAA
jgi:hypothetical protein